jgi:hypothetical protein
MTIPQTLQYNQTVKILKLAVFLDVPSMSSLIFEQKTALNKKDQRRAPFIFCR